MKKLFQIIFFVMMLLCSFSYAATISGNVYNFDLDLETKSMITINSTPIQRQFAQNGSYSFSLSPGKYKIEAYDVEDSQLKTSENITIVNDGGKYKLDLFLFFEPNEIVDDNIDLTLPEKEDYFLSNNIILMIVLALFFVFIAIYFLARKNSGKLKKLDTVIRKLESLDDKIKNDIIILLKRNHGFMSQKDIRKNFNYSEAKISLMIKELEKDSVIEKEKRGTINYIKLK